ncbi:putative multi antimicrobial extrusion protein [Helianthus annuus]|uniref:Protein DETOXIFICATION n=2 Tax=Helianthus annuus TaxID=4232 RepID=A0A251RYD3_HELAN|nr:protein DETOXIFICATION 44, chloroplastic isoform X1 [Helianthus annuus]KAF5759544.1 putative multi antimicrobial extrusion protein [Helianthus annuus]KAJ0437738.1 putative multi antimicrobial extrusion protein [Helianthus annuus]KAJ0460062.1 putative multi antimicrobial extrusion protein [Helianthus annuus]KAJ0640507.1 putative multi antimicrobial extrusion protein [Helianthus annuus]KAJ0644442.1 putative multi antimicrobial extrusion protein [Helianthus annuus]
MSTCIFQRQHQHHHRHLLLLPSQHDTRSFKLQSFTQIPSSSLRFRTLSSRQNPSAKPSLQNPQSDSQIASNDDDLYSPSASTESNPFVLTLLIQGFREKLGFDELGMEIMSIALPAALALAADPITSLVDTAFIGHLGSAELAAVGVSISLFNLVAKLLNIPLLNITTSFVAEEQAVSVEADDGSTCVNQDDVAGRPNKKFLPSVSTSLAMATTFGIAETIALSFGSGFLLNTMGIPVDSPMRVPAEQFTSIRAFGAPAIVLALAAQGTFRGFKDTKTPLYAIVAGNLLNAVLDLILIFFCGLGVSGAAIATVISEYLTAFILLWKLNEEVVLVTPNIDGEKVAQYLKSGGLLMSRSFAVLVTMTLSTSVAAREGSVPMAGHQICLEVWLALSLLTDALALAGQAILASSYSQRNYGEARRVIYRVLQISLIAGCSLSFILFFGFGDLSYLISTDSEVLNIAKSGTLFVVASQPVNAVAFVLDGLYYGVSDFGYASYSMVVIGLGTCAFFLLAGPKFGLAGVWTGLFVFMTLRVVAGIWRLGTKRGPWKLVYSETDQENR